MSTVTRRTTMMMPVDVPLPPQDLLETDGVPLETDWHRLAINLLIEVIRYHFRDRTDFFAGGNMFLYFSDVQARDRDYRGPDFFYVEGAERDRERSYWAVWNEEGRYPDVIIELASESTVEEDHTTKFRIYERTFRTAEYFIYNPASRLLEGWRLGSRQRYQPIKPDERGWLWSEELKLWLGSALSTYLFAERFYLRFFNVEGSMLPTIDESASQELAKANAEIERLRRDNAKLRKNRKKPKP